MVALCIFLKKNDKGFILTNSTLHSPKDRLLEKGDIREKRSRK